MFFYCNLRRVPYTSGTMTTLRRLTFLCLLLGLLSSIAQARVVSVEILSRTMLNGNSGPVGAGAYEKIVARVHFAVLPASTPNRGIVDLDKAPRNDGGEVEFSSDLFLLRPAGKGNGAMLLEIPNRGGKGILSLVDGGKANPANDEELGDGWLLKQGYTVAALGWQWDVADGLQLHAPIAYEKGGKSIFGLLRDDFTPTQKATDWPLGHVMGARLGGTEYPVARPADDSNVLTVRDTPHGPRTVIPRTQWSFQHSVNGQNGRLEASDRFVHFDGGFQAGKIYELVYVVKDPVVAGLGFAAVRDFVAWMKHSPDAIEPIKYVYAEGISQCGRFLRDFLYEGFNADESGQMALDGVLAHVGGGGRGSFNYRFAQPSRDAQPMSSIDWPTDIFPFTDLPENDPDHPTQAKLGLLDAATAEHVVPKIFFSHTSYEYWGRAASLIHTTADGKADVAISPNVRIYFYSGLQHFSVPFPPQIPKEPNGAPSAQQMPTPLPIRWFWRAMIANMDAWVRSGTMPPESRYPKIADGTLVPIAKLAFPAIPGVRVPDSNSQGWDLDFGPAWRQGILSKQPPRVVAAYAALVPRVDADGNDLGGIRLPEIVAPLATYTGWNLRSAATGAPGARTAFLGSFLPLPRNANEAARQQDSRKPIEDRYKSYDEYRGRFKTSLAELVRERYILAEDSDRLLERSREEWNWSMRQSPVN
ncbi:alpha/beta hydrolase domain-containing protein [Acidicapsa ligni]|uniref:alpha/beta hydrolase domain-containing protein n=1 Tax=Acidicapsa ligni TaxID=542300 RepID=UPI0021E02A35|nr:alpha/beta hydrolase domain-containing protein [Acidicapsa ligni]